MTYIMGYIRLFIKDVGESLSDIKFRGIGFLELSYHDFKEIKSSSLQTALCMS